MLYPKDLWECREKIAELTDSGITVHWFLGNHDMWIFNYMETELGWKYIVYPIRQTIQGKTF